MSINNIIKCSCVELQEHDMIIICIYRSPVYTKCIVEPFLDRLRDVLNKICFKNKKVVICGDFNLERFKKDSNAREFEQVLHTYNLKLSLNVPSRLYSRTCLDNIAHNVRGSKVNVAEFAISNHTAQIINCPVK